MPRRPISTLKELNALPLGGGGPKLAEGGCRPLVAAPPMVLPAPRRGGLFTQGEIAQALGVARGTVASWTDRGVGGVRLPTLRAPRGRVQPGALVAFLSKVNDCEVEVGS